MTRPDPMTPVPYTVLEYHRDTADVFTLTLAPADGGRRLDYRPGQFTMLYQFGVGEVPVSVSGDPGGEYLVQTIRAVGTVTRRMQELRPGHQLGVRGPFGSAWPVAAARGKDIVVVAGGLGLAPVRPILYEILGRRDDYGRVSLIYGTRSPADILYREELEAWRGRLDLEVEITVDRAPPGWRGDVGVVTNLLGRAPFDPARAVAMVCGPEIMMRFTAMGLIRAGLAGEAIYVSMERNMKCAVAWCGHCQLGPHFVCKDGPVFPYSVMEPLFTLREL